MNECVYCAHLGRSVRFADMAPESALKGKRKKKRLVKKTKAITPLQAMMLRMAGRLQSSFTRQAHFVHGSAVLIVL